MRPAMGSSARPAGTISPESGAPGRAVSAMVNLTDLYVLFAGIDDVAAAVPSRTVDAVPMLAYLTDPAATPARTWNYT
jgi:hypothetical protein